jgi:hypothetical protein
MEEDEIEGSKNTEEAFANLQRKIEILKKQKAAWEEERATLKEENKAEGRKRGLKGVLLSFVPP